MVGCPLKIQHALRLENPTGCFSFTFKNPSEILFCKIRRKIHHALRLENPAVFWFPLVQESVEKLVLQTPLFFPTSVEHGAPHESSALTFFHEQRAAPIECSILATRCLFTLVLGVQELSLVAWHYRLYQRSWIDLSKFAQTHTIDGTLDFLVYKALASAQAFLAIELLVDGITVRQELGEFSHSH